MLRATEITSGNASEIIVVAADTKGCRDRKPVPRRWSEEAGEEARDIYRCRVRCEVVPRVTGIRFPGAAGPCRETGPSFTSRTSLDLIHAPLRARHRPAHHHPIRTIALYSRPFVKHPWDHADRWHNAPCTAARFGSCPYILVLHVTANRDRFRSSRGTRKSFRA